MKKGSPLSVCCLERKGVAFVNFYFLYSFHHSSVFSVSTPNTKKDAGICFYKNKAAYIIYKMFSQKL